MAEEEYSSIAGNRSQIGNLSAKSIFISEKGKIRVANPFSWPDEARKSLPVYLPPEEIDNMRKGHKSSSSTNENSEQFGMGMTVLSAGILNESGDLYNH